MDYGNYEDSSVAVAIDLINEYATPVRGADGRDDHGQPLPGARGFFERHDLVYTDDGTGPDDLARLADRLHTVFTAADDATAVDVVNAVLAEAGAMPQISGHDDENWHLHYYPQDTGTFDRLAVTAAMGLATVLCTSGVRRLGECGGHGCRDVYVDTSRNNRRRFCGEGCANRAHVAAHRARQRDGA